MTNTSIPDDIFFIEISSVEFGCSENSIGPSNFFEALDNVQKLINDDKYEDYEIYIKGCKGDNCYIGTTDEGKHQFGLFPLNLNKK